MKQKDEHLKRDEEKISKIEKNENIVMPSNISHIHSGGIKKKPSIPILRTYENDKINTLGPKSEIEKRKDVVKKIEEKRKMQQQYKEDVKNLFKEEQILKEKQRNFSNEKNITNKEKSTPKIRRGDLSSIGIIETPKKEKPKEDFKPNVKEIQFDDLGLIKENNLEKRQENIVKKSKLEKKWKDFEVKKEKLKEIGLKSRDVRTYSNELVPKKQFDKVSIFSFIISTLLLIILVVIVFSIATKKEIEPVITIEKLQLSNDILNSERQEFINIDFKTDWNNISQSNGKRNIITKYVPYKFVGEATKQIELDEFSRVFSINIPERIYDTLNNYYFVGNYATKTYVNGIVVLSVKNYGDALVWLLDWEKYVINSFVNLFPGVYNSYKPENTIVETRIIDNKDVRIIRSPSNATPLTYYFFNRQILVFIIGDSGIIPTINSRIRSANS